MGRLIDTDVVKKRFAEVRFKGELADYDREIHDVFESVVDTTKIAFDKNKVLEELRNEAVYHYGDLIVDLEDVKAIVERGGVE